MSTTRARIPMNVYGGARVMQVSVAISHTIVLL